LAHNLPSLDERKDQTPMNIVDPILYQCRRQPPAAAMCAPGTGIGLISYRRLEVAIHNVSNRLVAFGFPVGNVVAIAIEDPILHVIFVLAAMRLGLVAVSLRAIDAFLPIGIDAVIADKDAVAAPMPDRIIAVDQGWIEGDGMPLQTHSHRQIEGTALCRLILTSGTSNIPKAVPLSHDLLARRMARQVHFGNRLASCSRIYCDIPSSSSLGFQSIVHTLCRGGLAMFSGEDFVSTLRGIQDYKIQCLISSPGGFENWLRLLDSKPNYQSDIEVIVSAGDVLSPSLSERLRSRICPHLVSIYGSTECSMTAVANGHEIDHEPRAVGFVAPGVTIEIVNADGHSQPFGTEGEIRVLSEFAADSYFRNSEETTKVFREGWFYPGDIGVLGADGLLMVTGRQQTVLNIGGDKVSPESIELILKQFPGVLETAVFAVANAFGNNELWAAFVSSGKIDEQLLRGYCESRLPRPIWPVKYLFADTLPMNDNGKLDRRAVERKFVCQSVQG
jgi:acyl-coenzyme A synthetase/AMP-(fatty) acid ligase